ncbi:carbon monoxide dehydrogenase subunit G [Streptomyces sp. NBC_01451]|uniref:carbon monoxide dehydrogenase subunit G n=1 Tax=Streptomyces sp. NBC_01451 TaxID=2903872 RepID=UPI002E35CC1C|nr:carbon monoxide dehydrogenase subunit G [Streptomyces sp. NBC_01451]
MDHEVFVPVPAERLRDVLADPARIARAVPGLQQDAGGEPAAAEVAGRLKVRIGSHTITYRGTLRVAVADGRDSGPDSDLSSVPAAAEDVYVVEGDAVEARGGGAVKVALTLRVRGDEDAGGSMLVFGGTVTADGRVSDLPADAVSAAGARLLRRFGEGLGEEAAREPERPGSAEGPERPEGSEGPDGPEGSEGPEHVEASEASEAFEAPPAVVEIEVSGVDVPDDPGALDDDLDGDLDEDEQVSERFMGTGEPPAEAAHARRTMIGRSAEEVDHAPPRGRYAPVPPPEQVAGNATLRWAAPAAALVVASAIVVGRVLRKRR